MHIEQPIKRLEVLCILRVISLSVQLPSPMPIHERLADQLTDLDFYIRADETFKDARVHLPK